MTDQLFFSRDTKVYVQKGSYHWEIPVLEGFSFSQATNTSEITLAEMADSAGTSRRGRQMFNDSLAPAEWSFSTYARPFKSSGSGSANGVANYHHAVEEVLWAQMVGEGTYSSAASNTGGFVLTGGTAATITTLGTAVSLTVNGDVNDANTVVFDTMPSTIKVGQRVTVGNVTAFVATIDSTAKSVTFDKSVTVADDASIAFNSRFATQTTVTGVPTTSNNNGQGATVQIVANTNGTFSVTLDNGGTGYASGDHLLISAADIAAAFSTALNRTLASDYTASSGDGRSTTPSTSTTGTSFSNLSRTTSDTSGLLVGFGGSNKTTLGTFDLVFVLGGSTGDSSKQKIYKISNCCVNEAALDFDIDGITTINWSGMGTLIEDVASPGVTGTPITEATTDTSNFIRNRLTSLSAVSSLGGTSTTYDLVLTSGNITITNNMSYLTPETLGIVNTPLGHVTGTRSVTGSFTCYLNKENDSSAELFNNLISNTSTVTNEFALQFNVGGSSSRPRIEFDMDRCHLEIPTHSLEDVISLEANFHALPSSVEATNEVTVRYVGS